MPVENSSGSKALQNSLLITNKNKTDTINNNILKFINKHQKKIGESGGFPTYTDRANALLNILLHLDPKNEKHLKLLANLFPKIKNNLSKFRNNLIQLQNEIEKGIKLILDKANLQGSKLLGKVTDKHWNIGKETKTSIKQTTKYIKKEIRQTARKYDIPPKEFMQLLKRISKEGKLSSDYQKLKEEMIVLIANCLISKSRKSKLKIANYYVKIVKEYYKNLNNNNYKDYTVPFSNLVILIGDKNLDKELDNIEKFYLNNGTKEDYKIKLSMN